MAEFSDLDELDQLSTMTLIITILLSIITTILVGTRISVRIAMRDYSVLPDIVVAFSALAGIILTLLLCILSNIALVDGTLGTVSGELNKVSITSQAFYQLSSTVAKLSTVFQYVRHFAPTRSWIGWIYIGALFPAFVVCICILIAQCGPIKALAPDKCRAMRVYWIVEGAVTIATSALVVILPLPWIHYHLSGSRWHRSIVIAIVGFGLGGLLVEVLRLNTSIIGSQSKHADLVDSLRLLLHHYLWSALDAAFWICFACAPAFYLVQILLPNQPAWRRFAIRRCAIRRWSRSTRSGLISRRTPRNPEEDEIALDSLPTVARADSPDARDTGDVEPHSRGSEPPVRADTPDGHGTGNNAREDDNRTQVSSRQGFATSTPARKGSLNRTRRNTRIARRGSRRGRRPFSRRGTKARDIVRTPLEVIPEQPENNDYSPPPKIPEKSVTPHRSTPEIMYLAMGCAEVTRLRGRNEPHHSPSGPMHT
ncbi:hypothetical protein VTO42DRAFT_5353 [Malbranchea cinnamomea]